jgi:hypothetical protein
MPNDTKTSLELGPVFDAARAAVTTWLECLGAAPLHPLSAAELQAYKGHNAVAGWRLSIQLENRVRRFDILLPQGLPWKVVRIALVDRPPFLTWPHIEKDGVLCLSSDSFEIDPDDPAGVAACLLDEAVQLVLQVSKGELVERFQDEFNSYWSYGADRNGASIVSLLRAEPPSRMIKFWRGQAICLLAETEAELYEWLANRHGNKPSGFRARDAALVWVKSPPQPSAYPNTGSELREMVDGADKTGVEVLSNLISKRPETLIVALGFDTRHGPTLAGAIVPAPKKATYGATDPLTKGFRSGSIPPVVLEARYLGGSKVSRRIVERADAEWVHGRGHDPRAALLRQKTVAVFGCGSVGGAIALQLAQAGIGHLILVDPDTLKWPNIGRHVLGAPSVDQAKAKALAEKLRRDFPHIQVTAHVADADTFLREHGGTTANVDLALSMTASWVADRRVEAWQRAAERPPPVLYGWLEAHACAGHAVLVGGPPGSIQSGFDGTGLPHFTVTTWGSEDTVRQEPGCGAVFQPYGPVELSMANAVICELALDALLGAVNGPMHRVWVGPCKRVEQAGGAWSENWQCDPSFRHEGGFVFERAWPTASSKKGEAAAV